MNVSPVQRNRIGVKRRRATRRKTGIPDALVEGLLCAIRKAIDHPPQDVPAEFALPIALHRIGMELGRKVEESVMHDSAAAQLNKGMMACLALDQVASLKEIQAVSNILIRASRVELRGHRLKLEVAAKVMEIGIGILQEEQLAKNRKGTVRPHANRE